MDRVITSAHYLGLRVGDDVLGPIPPAQDPPRLMITVPYDDAWGSALGTSGDNPSAAPIAESLRTVHVLPFCRCPDPHSTIGATGPVVCRNCGRRIGGDR